MTDALDARVTASGHDGAGLTDLVGLALRRNPRRAHLLVSRVLGKHLPCDPRLARAAGLVLGHRVGAFLRGDPSAPVLPPRAVVDVDAAVAARDAALARATPRVPSVVVGVAENATGLARFVADALDADHVVTSTRRVVPDAAVLGAFTEPHSHAGRHLLLPDEPGRWTPELPVVLVDDELTTGRTVADVLRLLHRACPRPRYVVAALVDVRDGDDDAVERAAAELGVRVDAVALARGSVRVPGDATARAAALARRWSPAGPPPAATVGALATTHLGLDGAPERHGVDRAGRAGAEAALPPAVAALAEVLGPVSGRVHVLGTEELVALPVRLAEGLADRGYRVTVGATTRSPAVVVDAPGYALRSAITFPAHDAALGTVRERYAYDVGRPGAIVLVVDDDARAPALHGPGGLVARLRALAPRVVEVVVPSARPRGAVPARRGPSFGTFAPDEVGWLLDDLSGVAPEVEAGRRERDVRAGRVHYSETLPRETRPSPAYDALVQRTIARSAGTVAALVGRVTATVLAGGRRPVLVSLARAGTPVAVLMRRWARREAGVDLPHYALSVIRGRGVDRTALAAVTAVHDPASLVFVDGWTGKGLIVDELARGPVAAPTVVALSDPAHVVAVPGTRDDVLVPSACLTATVCGLISRTVRRHADGPDGAVFHPGLADADRTATFLDAVTACLGPTAPVAPAPPDRRGPAYVDALGAELGVADPHRLKPGLGETTRMLLRRMPEAVLLADDAGDDAEHLHVLARERGVPVRALPAALGGVATPYRSVGLIRA